MAYSSFSSLIEFELWDRMESRRKPLSFDIEITPRCNLNCRHCYINLPAGDKKARQAELTFQEIEEIAGQAVALGVVWCLVTGGEPLLRPDFADIYLMLKRLGLLVSLFTNACLVTPEHAALFKRYPPRTLEVTVYGITPATYERVTRRRGAYAQFRRGLVLLQDAGVKVGLKAMALQSNLHEFPAIAAFCRARSAHTFRFDPLLQLRYDGDAQRNAEIRAERLSPKKIVAIEQADEDRSKALQKNCWDLYRPEFHGLSCDHIFHCGAGLSSFSVSYDGYFKLCSSLTHPECVYNLRAGTLREAWQDFVPAVRDLRSQSAEFLTGCHRCPLVNLCLWCPASSALESGNLDARVEAFCQVARARYAAHLQPVLEE